VGRGRETGWERACRLTILVPEQRRVQGRGVCEELLERARHTAIAGATVWQGVAGQGPGAGVRPTPSASAPDGLPWAFEVVDRRDLVDAFLEVVRTVAPEALVVLEDLEVTGLGGSALRLDDGAP